MIHLLAILLCITGFVALATAMDRHQRDIIGRKLAPDAALRIRSAGGALLIAALAVNMIGLGAAYGTICWFGHLSLGAATVLSWLIRKAPAQKSKSKP